MRWSFLRTPPGPRWVLKKARALPIRLLLIGLPLTILLGIGLGVHLIDKLSLFEIALLATLLAPTDAALGKAVVTNEAVPDDVRQGLNVESGLNDGICVPILFVFLALITWVIFGSAVVILVMRSVETLPRMPIKTMARYSQEFQAEAILFSRLASGRKFLVFRGARVLSMPPAK